MFSPGLLDKPLICLDGEGICRIRPSCKREANLGRSTRNNIHSALLHVGAEMTVDFGTARNVLGSKTNTCRHAKPHLPAYRTHFWQTHCRGVDERTISPKVAVTVGHAEPRAADSVG